MIVKKFQAPTEREAIIKAQEDLGSTAVVLNVKTIKQRGFAKLFKKDAVEVTAALEEKDFVDGINKSRPSFDNTMNKEQMINRSMVSTGSLPSINLVADDSVNLSSSSTASAIEQKLDSLHDLLQNQSFNKPADVQGTVSNPYSGVAGSVRSLYNDDTDIKSASSDNTERQQVKQRENANYKSLQLIYKKLIDNEVDSRYADEIIGEIENSLKKESNIDSILSAVYQKIILKLGKPRTITLSDKAKVVFFIGPTGVGKTTTIAKIASSFKLEHEAKVAFITADTYRIAAVEQLNTYASIIDCPVSVVYSVEDMDKSLTDYKDYDLILIDTAGRLHNKVGLMNELTKIKNVMKKVVPDAPNEVLLVLDGSTGQNAFEQAKQFTLATEVTAMAITKLDGTAKGGVVIGISDQFKIPVKYIGLGEGMEDLQVFRKKEFVDSLFGENA